MSSQEEPEDQQPDDQAETGGDDVGTDDASSDDSTEDGDAGQGDAAKEPPTDDERIQQITERIDKARSQAEEAGVLEDTEDEHFADSGATEEEDDQTAAPPG